MVLISGHDGGTGAAPLTSIKHAGVPWELGLAETQQVLRLNGLRGRITVQTDGQLKTGRDVIVAALLGAEEFGFATAPLVVSGCVMMRVCHLNTCPVGIATQDPVLRARFTGDPAFVVNFFRFIAEEVREHMAALGFPHDGRDDWTRSSASTCGRPSSTGRRADSITPPCCTRPRDRPRRRAAACRRRTTDSIARSTPSCSTPCREALVHRRPVMLERRVRNVDRAIGTMLGSEITRQWGGEGLPDDTITLRCTGSAGQSFGAFIPRGISLRLEGDANDFLGKGLSGGRIAVLPPRGASFIAEENIIVGNVVLYGATSGEAYIRGVAGERFAVRNSGATAVVEGVGDHGCEYMTGGRVAVLGRTGRNFAAGMSGGIAYVFDARGDFAVRCNQELVDLEALGDADERELRQMLEQHAELTGSSVAASLLAGWSHAVGVVREGHAARLQARAARMAEAAVAAVSREQVAHG